MDDLNSLLKTAIDETSHVREGETFLVKDLFKGYEWNRIPKETDSCWVRCSSAISAHMTARLPLPTKELRASSGIRSIEIRAIGWFANLGLQETM